MARLANRRQATMDAMTEKHEDNGGGLFGNGIPFWMRLALNTFMPKRFGGFWPQALLTAAPVVFGLAKTVTGSFNRDSEKSSGIFGFLPLVKSLIKRYN